MNENVDRAKSRDLLINKVLPAIQERWPWHNLNPDNPMIIRIQQDNAPANIKGNDEEWLFNLKALRLGKNCFRGTTS